MNGNLWHVNLSVLDEKVEGTFIDIFDGSEMEHILPWYGSNPNQGRDGNNILIYTMYQQLLDTSGSRASCTICEAKKVSK